MNAATWHQSTSPSTVSHAGPFHPPRSHLCVSPMSRRGQECPGWGPAPECLQSPQSLVTCSGLGSMVLGTGRGIRLCSLTLLAIVRLGEQAQLLGDRGEGSPLQWLPQFLADQLFPLSRPPSSCSGQVSPQNCHLSREQPKAGSPLDGHPHASSYEQGPAASGPGASHAPAGGDGGL